MAKITDIKKTIEILEKKDWYIKNNPRKVKDCFKDYPENVDKQIVQRKISVANSFYRTRMPVQRTAEYITSIKNLDQYLSDGNIAIVEKIVAQLKNMDGKKHYSFATKYCAVHNPKAFPIYDSIVANRFKKMLKDGSLEPEYIYGKDKGYTVQYFESEVLKKYKEFKKLYDFFIEKYGISETYKYYEIDQYIWGAGKDDSIKIQLDDLQQH